MSETISSRVKDICRLLDVPEPVEFLTQVMAGTDPRRQSFVYQLVLEIESKQGDGLPDEWDWEELKAVIKERYQHAPASLGDSHRAATQIMEYTHPKRRAMELTGDGLANTKTTELTAEEVRLFRRKFKSEY